MFLFSPQRHDRLCDQPNVLFIVYRGLENGPGRETGPHLQLIPMLRTHEAIPPYVFIVCCLIN
jgi:hypothetical protein